MIVHDGSNSKLVMNSLDVWELTEIVLIPSSPWLEEIMRKAVTGLGFAKLMTGAVVAIADRATEVTGHLGRQDSVFSAAETNIMTGMQPIADIIHKFGFALTKD